VVACPVVRDATSWWCTSSSVTCAGSRRSAADAGYVVSINVAVAGGSRAARRLTRVWGWRQGDNALAAGRVVLRR
jgi:hypothetical protein